MLLCYWEVADCIQLQGGYFVGRLTPKNELDLSNDLL
jgi:hypothetical protein